MSVEKSIIIGCDDMEVSSQLQHVVNEIRAYALNTISITNGFSLYGVVKSIHPAIIILCFRNNNKILREVAAFSRENQIPILSINRHLDSKALIEFSNSIIFSYDFKYISQKGYIKSAIKSILRLLKTNSPAGSYQKTLGGNAGRFDFDLEQKTKILSKVKSRIKQLHSTSADSVRSELDSIINLIDNSTLDKKLWADFKLYFEEINPGFLSKLTSRYPILTPIDLKYCCYLKMNMSNYDICKLLGISQESVRTHKYRLKKKLVLPKEKDLHNYMMSMQ